MHYMVGLFGALHGRLFGVLHGRVVWCATW